MFFITIEGVYMKLLIAMLIGLLISCSSTYQDNTDIESNITNKQRSDIEQLKNYINNGYLDSIEPTWEEVTEDLNPLIDIEAFIQYVMREAYAKLLEDLEEYAEKVKQYNESQKKVREEIQKIKEQLASLREHILLAESFDVYKTRIEIEKLIKILLSFENPSNLESLKLQLEIAKQRIAVTHFVNVVNSSDDEAKSIINNTK
jgi:hypothetical protein